MPTQQAVLRSVSTALQQATLRSIGREVYGASVAERATRGGPLSIAGRAIDTFDQMFADECEKTITPLVKDKPPQTAPWRATIEAMMVRPSPALNSLVNTNPTLGMLWSLLQTTTVTPENRASYQLLNYGLNAAVIDRASVPRGVNEFYLDAQESYDWMVENSPKDFRPLFVSLSIEILNGAVTAGFSVMLKPAPFSKVGGFADGNVIKPIEVTYEPLFNFGNLDGRGISAQYQSVMQLSMRRTYNGPNASEPLLQIDFGKLGPDHDVRFLFKCLVDDCTEIVKKVPTIVLKLQSNKITEKLGTEFITLDS